MKSNKISYTDTPLARPEPTHDQVAALAHAIWVDQGYPAGRDLEHWLEAERQLSGKTRADEKVLAPDDSLDPERSTAGRIERALDRVYPPSTSRSPTSL